MNERLGRALARNALPWPPLPHIATRLAEFMPTPHSRQIHKRQMTRSGNLCTVRLQTQETCSRNMLHQIKSYIASGWWILKRLHPVGQSSC